MTRQPTGFAEHPEARVEAIELRAKSAFCVHCVLAGSGDVDIVKTFF
jgi:hypothetical protein